MMVMVSSSTTCYRSTLAKLFSLLFISISISGNNNNSGYSNLVLLPLTNAFSFSSITTSLKSSSRQQRQINLQHATGDARKILKIDNDRQLVGKSSSSSSLCLSSNNNDDSSSSTNTGSSSSSSNVNNYVRLVEDSKSSSSSDEKPLYPKIGDIVRYYDLMGGNTKGEVLVGMITYFQKQLTPENKDDEWIVDIKELDDVGDGYYAEPSSRSRKRASRNLKNISPAAAAYVRSENAYKIPTNKSSGEPSVLRESYTIKGFTGIMESQIIDPEVIAEDNVKYDSIKVDLIKNTAIFGLSCAIITNFVKGTEDALIFILGNIASLGYLFFLSQLTDTVAGEQTMGSKFSKIRFFFPFFGLLAIAVRNFSMGDASPVAGGIDGASTQLFNYVTPEQFTIFIIGFLAYRIPLFVSQLTPVLQETGEAMLPGSIGVAMDMAKKQKENEKRGIETGGSSMYDDLVTVLLISGPEGTRRSKLVERLLQDDDNNDNRFVVPNKIDRLKDGAKFELLKDKEQFLYLDPNEKYGITKDSILNAATTSSDSSSAGEDDVEAALARASSLLGDNSNDDDADEEKTKDDKKVVVVDANVDFVQKILKINGIRVIAVWISKDNREEFETYVQDLLDNNKPITFRSDLLDGTDDNEQGEKLDSMTNEQIKRLKMKEIIKDIEYGITSGIFEFTIIDNDDSDFEESYKRLKRASGFCFD